MTGVTWRAVRDRLPGREREGFEPPTGEMLADLRVAVLERMKLLNSTANERPTKTEEHLADAVLFFAQQRHDEALDLTPEAATGAVLAELAADVDAIAAARSVEASTRGRRT